MYVTMRLKLGPVLRQEELNETVRTVMKIENAVVLSLHPHFETIEVEDIHIIPPSQAPPLAA